MLRKIQPITLNELRNGVTNFTAPQSYLYLDNYSELKKFIYNNIVLDGDIIINNLEKLFPDKLCR